MGAFGKDFDWGIASSAYQIEGAWLADGKGPSIWDTYTQRPGVIAGGGTGQVGCDHYHRWQEDVALLKALGVRTYRLSVSWPRVFPQGDGPINEKGLDFYRRLVEALLEAGISPVVNLHHYDLPEALYRRGGWMRRDTADAYVRYARAVFDALAPQVCRFMTFNDIRGTLLGGYVAGERAPGHYGMLREAIQGWHNMHIAGAMAMADFRGRHVAGGDIGAVMGVLPVRAMEDTAECRVLAQNVQLYFNDAFLSPLIAGKYPDEVLETVDAIGMMPCMTDGELALLAANPVDFIGVSYYTPMNIRVSPHTDPRNPMSLFTRVMAEPQTALGWEIDPQGMYEALIHLRDHYGNPRCLVGETGAAFADRHMASDTVQDDDRIAYLQAHIDQVARAIKDGCRVEGLHVWSLLDHFEWQHGFTKGFGLVRVDHEAGHRYPKKSFNWYWDFIAGQV